MDSKIDLKDYELEKLAQFLQKSCGIHLEEKKLQRFKRKIENIFHKNDIENFNSFYHKLRFLHSEELIQDLINAVTVNETYFWREHEQFEILIKEILPGFVQMKRLSNVRILVLPCSSGEEVYSIMLGISEDEKLLEKLNIEILGVDIDSDMIKKAKKGLYSQRSINKLPKHLLKRYFTLHENFYKLDSNLVKSANFMQANIFDEKFVDKIGKFDIIFSRNMLIYFNSKDKQRCYDIFYKLLKDENSYLFLGHADANNIDKNYFLPLKYGFHIFKKAKICLI